MKYKYITLDNQVKNTIEQITVLIVANPASDHIDFPWRNSFFDSLFQNETIENNVKHLTLFLQNHRINDSVRSKITSIFLFSTVDGK